MAALSHIQLGSELGLSDAAMEALSGLRIPEDRAAGLKTAFEEDFSRFEAEIRREENPELLVLGLYLRWAEDTWDRYVTRGISREIFLDTFRDLAIWADAFERENGRPGLGEWGWCGRSVKMELFRLGRLQFQPDCLPEALEAEGERYEAGTPVLQVHIPAGEKLTPEAVAEALGRAKGFFGGAYELFICRSWLLSPALEALLPEQSNILQFKRRFTLWGTGSKRQAEERVFGRLLDDPAGYPEDTALQRALKGHLLEGKRADMGFGFIRFRDI